MKPTDLPAARLGAILAAACLLAVVACGDGLYPEDFTPSPVPTRAPPTPTPLPHRADCKAIRDSATFLSVPERAWFMDNCISLPLISVGYNSLPLVGGRVMEAYEVPTDVCKAGVAVTTIEEELNGELFSYLFRTFCWNIRPQQLSQLPAPLVCDPGEMLTSEEVTLSYYTGFSHPDTEVFCVPEEPDPTATPATTPIADETAPPEETAAAPSGPA